jgi:hypothetical protein
MLQLGPGRVRRLAPRVQQMVMRTTHREVFSALGQLNQRSRGRRQVDFFFRESEELGCEWVFGWELS